MLSTSITPRVSETDGAGHVNNAFVPVWFEAGRREIFRILTPSLAFAEWRVAMVSMRVDYTRQIFFHAEVEIRTWIERIGNKSFTVYEEAWQEGALCAKGTATYVYFDYRAQRAEALPEAERRALAAHLRER